MFRTVIVSLALCVCLAITACAELVVRTKDGRTFKVAVDATEIASIEFTAPAPAPTPVSVAPEVIGRWSGTYHNSLGVTGATSLVLKRSGSVISGELDGDAIPNAQWDGQTLSFSLYLSKSSTSYRYQFKLTGEKTARVTYEATSPTRSYTGYADYTRQ